MERITSLSRSRNYKTSNPDYDDQDKSDKKKFNAPKQAYRPDLAYDSARDSGPKEIEYGTYRKLGLIKNVGQSVFDARCEAKRRYGEKADVIMTARYYVAYVIE